MPINENSTNAFDDLLKSFATNIKALKVSNQGRSVRISGINPVEVLIISQNQMKSTAEELRRSANVGIGYAFELDEIKNFFDNQ